MRARFKPETFKFDIHRIRHGYYSAVYFRREKEILESIGYDKKVLMQVFQKKNAILAGISEAIAVLKLASGSYGFTTKIMNDYFNEYSDIE